MVSSGIGPGISSTQSTNDVYTDLSSINAIRSVGLKDKSKALDEIAKQFESMMVRMMLKSMRDANNVFAKDNFLSSHEGDTYQQMYDDQLAVSLTTGRGMGLAEIMAKQLQSRFNNTSNTAIKTENELPRNGSLHSITVNTKGKIDSTVDLPVSKPAPQIDFDGSIKSFVKHVYPLAVTAAQKLGIDPEILIAQSALETGWGSKITQSRNEKSSFNLFNIKADKRWQGESVVVPTIEFRNGLPVKESAVFRSYSSLQKSVEDYVTFINDSSRYAKALISGDSKSYIQGLSEAGYATDPQYAAKVLKIADSVGLKEAISSVRRQHASVLSAL